MGGNPGHSVCWVGLPNDSTWQAGQTSGVKASRHCVVDSCRVSGISVCSLSVSVSLNVFLSLLLKPFNNVMRQAYLRRCAC